MFSVYAKCLTSERRQLLVNKTCTKLRKEIPDELSLAPSYEEMYVDDTRRYIYCLVSKAACTSWKRTLLKLSGNETVSKFLNGSNELKFQLVHDRSFSNKVLKRLEHFSPDEQHFRLKNYYKFMFVREPLERLLSAYRDKMIRDAEYVMEYVPIIARKYHKNNETTFSEYRIA
jgi:Sulfotransferase family